MFTVLNYSISRDFIASVHRTGCKDIERDAREHAAIPYFGFATVAEALADYIDGEMAEMGYSADDVKVYSCCR